MFARFSILKIPFKQPIFLIDPSSFHLKPLLCGVNSENLISLKPYNTFGLDVSCTELHTVDSRESLESLFEDGIFERNPKIISGGSNLLLTANITQPVILNRIKGNRIQEETEEHIIIEFGAGESWHDSVLHAVANNWGGMENLSLIPGCMGAAPIQNIGAYGIELKDIFHELKAFHIYKGEYHTFNLDDCKFGYRDSVFKNSLKNQYFITEVSLRLDKNPKIRTQYGDIQAVIDAKNLDEIGIADISAAIIEIRQSKLPDPAQIGNSGSFFKNPVISSQHAALLKSKYPNLKYFPVNDLETKIPAAWLIENAGWKGYRRGNIGVHEKQALVLVNYGNGNGTEIKKLAEEIQNDVRQKFDITLDFEVNIW